MLDITRYTINSKVEIGQGEICSECGWTGPDSNGQYHAPDCQLVDEQWEKLKKSEKSLMRLPENRNLK